MDESPTPGRKTGGHLRKGRGCRLQGGGANATIHCALPCRVSPRAIHLKVFLRREPRRQLFASLASASLLAAQLRLRQRQRIRAANSSLSGLCCNHFQSQPSVHSKEEELAQEGASRAQGLFHKRRSRRHPHSSTPTGRWVLEIVDNCPQGDHAKLWPIAHFPSVEIWRESHNRLHSGKSGSRALGRFPHAHFTPTSPTSPRLLPQPPFWTVRVVVAWSVASSLHRHSILLLASGTDQSRSHSPILLPPPRVQLPPDVDEDLYRYRVIQHHSFFRLPQQVLDTFE